MARATYSARHLWPARLSCLLVLPGAGCASQGLPEVIYLARHGQTEFNRVARYQGDPDLDPVGYINRVSLWRLLRDVPLGAVYTSERQRTRRTADLVARQHGLPIQARAALNEINAGILEGICFSQMAPGRATPQNRECEVAVRGSHPEAALRVIRGAFDEAERDRLHGRIPLGESYDDLRVKTATFIDELRRGLRQRRVLVVGHGVINRVLLHHLMGWPAELLSHLRQENDQVYRLQTPADGGEPRLSRYTPGTGWRRCARPTRPGQRELDCKGGGRQTSMRSTQP